MREAYEKRARAGEAAMLAEIESLFIDRARPHGLPARILPAFRPGRTPGAKPVGFSMKRIE